MNLLLLSSLLLFIHFLCYYLSLSFVCFFVIIYLFALFISEAIVPDSSITASSFDDDHEPHKIRANQPGWMPETDKLGEPYVTVDLRDSVELHGIATAGSHDNPCWPSKYKVAISQDGENWEFLKVNGTNTTRVRLKTIYIVKVTSVIMS